MRFQLKRVNDELHIHQSAGQQLYIQCALWRLMRGHVLAHRRNIMAQLCDVALCMQNIADDFADLAARAC